MKAGILTNVIYSNVPEYIKYTDDLKKLYCERQGIDYLRLSKNNVPGLHPVWCKPGLILDVLKNYDWIVWMDADAATVNHNFDLKSYLSGIDDKIIIIKDINNWNAGVFAVSNKPNSIRWLEMIESHKNDSKYQHGWREQQAMIDSFDSEWKDIVFQPPVEIGWNSYMNIYGRKEPNLYIEGKSWCVHLPGIGDGKRKDIFRDIEAVWNI